MLLQQRNLPGRAVPQQAAPAAVGSAAPWCSEQKRLAIHLSTEGFFSAGASSARPPGRGPWMCEGEERKGLPLQDEGQQAYRETGYVRSLKWWNRLAYVAHLAQCIAVAVFFARSSESAREPYRLTTIRSLVDLAGGPSMGLAEGMGGCLAGSHYAEGSVLRFRAQAGGGEGGVTSLGITPFVARTRYELSLGWLLASFFMLSSIFQCLGVEGTRRWTLMLGRPSHLYDEMADGQNKSVGAFFMLSSIFQWLGVEGTIRWALMLGRPSHLYDEMADGQNKSVWAVNWPRFAEYSVSASVMVLAVSLVAGVTDASVLLSSLFLTWGCMVAGIGAELLLRLSQVSKDEETRSLAWRLAVGAHAAGWVFVAVPWSIIITQYGYLFSLCELGADCAAAIASRSPSPPDAVTRFRCGGESRGGVEPPAFVQSIVWAQFVLFVAFGFVQLVQISMRGRDLRLGAEAAYITLSLVAKTVLCWLVASNLFFQA
jgi:hypothetical protein